MINLFPDQDEVRTKLRIALRSSGSVLVYAPTGFGKTVLAAALIKSIFDAGKTVIFCVHRVDLITQTAKTFKNFGIPFSYIAADHHYNPYHRVFIASIDTLKNRLGKIKADYVIVDEAHLSAAAGWSKIAAHYKAAGARLIGLTGSPERLDGKPLGDIWDQLVLGPSLSWLIQNKRLSRYRAFAPKGLNLLGVKSRNGEYVNSELEDLMSGKAVLSNAVKHWKAKAFGKRTIGFAPSVKAAELLAQEFRDAGIVAVALDGNTPQPERKRAFLGFADRQVDLIINCFLFCEGFDLSAQVDRNVTIEAVLDNSPTQSLARHLQKHGRGLRWDGTDEPHILLDLVGGFDRLGYPDDEREWSLEGRSKPVREVENMTCPKCFFSHRGGLLKCPDCGHVYVAREVTSGGGSRVVEEVEGELEERDVEADRAAKKQMHDAEARAIAGNLIKGKDTGLDRSMQRQLETLVKEATDKGFKSPERWAAHIITARLEKQRARADEHAR